MSDAAGGASEWSVHLDVIHQGAEWTTSNGAFLCLLNSMIKVNVGCGNNFHKDWSNLDAQPIDPTVRTFVCGETLPFATDSVYFVYSSHLIEHLRPLAGLDFVVECHRVVKPGGWIRLVTPDFAALAIE